MFQIQQITIINYRNNLFELKPYLVLYQQLVYYQKNIINIVILSVID